jgi:hypothetical protein
MRESGAIHARAAFYTGSNSPIFVAASYQLYIQAFTLDSSARAGIGTATNIAQAIKFARVFGPLMQRRQKSSDGDLDAGKALPLLKITNIANLELSRTFFALPAAPQAS